MNSLANLKNNLYDMIYNSKYGMETIGGRENIKNSIVGIIYAFSKNPNFLKKNFIKYHHWQ